MSFHPTPLSQPFDKHILSTECTSKASETAKLSPTLNDLLNRATEDHGALINMAWTKHLTDSQALHIAAKALDGAIEDWCFENNALETDILPALRDGALATLLSRGWDAREKFLQARLFDDLEIWVGAARHEARRALE